MVGAKLANLSHGQKKPDTAIAVTQSDAAAQLSVSEDSIQRARKVLQSGDDDLIHAVERGDISVSAAAAVAELPWFMVDEHANARLTSV